MTKTNELERPKFGSDTKLIDRAIATAALPTRRAGAHKWSVGGLVVVAGSPGYAGAAILATLGASRAGAGIVNVALPRSLTATLNILAPEAVTITLPDGDSSAATRRAAEMIEARLEKSTAMVIGPGLGDDEATELLLGALFGGRSGRTAIGFGSAGNAAGPASDGGGLIAGSGKPLVIDADGLNWLSHHDEWWRLLNPGQAVLTPHLGEFCRLTGEPEETVERDPVAAARAAAKKWKQVVLLKYGFAVVTDGATSLVADDSPPSLATAGTGDVLAGTIGAFLAQGVAPLSAAALAVFAGTRAARKVEERTGTLGLVAGDLPLAIAAELAELERAKEDGGV